MLVATPVPVGAQWGTMRAPAGEGVRPWPAWNNVAPRRVRVGMAVLAAPVGAVRRASRLRRSIAALGVMLVVVLGASSAADASDPTVMFTTAGETPVVIPPGVTSLQIDAIGGAGENGFVPRAGLVGPSGGAGAEVVGTLPVTPGETIYVDVGIGGGIGILGAGGESADAGGGESGVRLCPLGTAMCPDGLASDSTQVLVAGGGGGGGEGPAATPGGAGGNAGVYSGGGLIAARGGDGEPAPSGAGGGGGGVLVGACVGGASNDFGGAGAGGTSSGSTGGNGGQVEVAAFVGGGGGGGYAGGCGGGASPTFAGGGGGGASFYNNPDQFDYESVLPTVTYVSSTTSPTNVEPQVTLTLTGDSHAPSVALGSPASGSQYGSQPRFDGTAEVALGDATSVSVQVEAQPSGTVVQTLSGPVAANGTFDIAASAPLPSGTYRAVATQTLLGGNNPGTATSTFTVDASPPAISLSAPANGLVTAATSVAVNGTAGTQPKDGNTVTVSLYSGPAATGTPITTLSATAAAGGRFSASYPGPLSDGTYTVAASQTDNGADTGTATSTFTIDTSVLTLTLGAPSAGEQLGAQPTFSGTADTAPLDVGSVTVLVYAGASASGSPALTLTGPVGSNGAFAVSAPSPLAAGTYTVVAEQSTQAGNVGRTPPVTFTVLSLTPGTNTTSTNTTSTNTTTTTAGATSSASSGVKASTTVTAPPSLSLIGSISGTGGHVRLTLACRATAPTPCNVSVSLSSLEHLKAGRVTAVAASATRLLGVGSARTLIRAGHRLTLTVALNRPGRQLLLRFRRLPLRLQVTLSGTNGPRVVLTRTATVTPTRTKTKH